MILKSNIYFFAYIHLRNDTADLFKEADIKDVINELDTGGIQAVFRNLGLNQAFITKHRAAQRSDAEETELRVLNSWTQIKCEAKLSDLLTALRATNKNAAERLHKDWKIPYPV